MMPSILEGAIAMLKGGGQSGDGQKCYEEKWTQVKR